MYSARPADLYLRVGKSSWSPRARAEYGWWPR